MYRVDCSRLRFLIVDDNSYMRRIVRTLLHGFGTREVFEAEDGAAGLESFSHNLPDIVIVDWSMPVFDGIQLSNMIRKPDTSANPFVPIIMMTGYAERSRVFQAREAGVSEMLVKPISAKSLYTRIERVVLNPRPFIRSENYFGPDRRHLAKPESTTERLKSVPVVVDYNAA